MKNYFLGLGSVFPGYGGPFKACYLKKPLRKKYLYGVGRYVN